MRTFIAKSSSSLQVQDRLSKGADFLEFQIHDNFGSFLTGDNDPRIRRIIPDADKYVSVHSRLSAVLHKECDIFAKDEWTEKSIEEAFLLADKIGEKAGRKIGVVVHTGIGFQLAEGLGIFDDMARRVSTLLFSFPDTEIWIENGSTPFGKGCTIEDKAEVINKLRESLPEYKNRIYSVFDTTHAMMYARAMFGCEETTDVSLYTDGFTAFAATCKEIHFVNCIKNGEGADRHGVNFEKASPKDMIYFNFSMQCIDRFMPDAFLCIEVSEENYEKAEHFGNILEMIKNYDKEKKKSA